MSAIVVTTYVWGDLAVLEAASVSQLARKLYRRFPFWTEATCGAMAASLARGRVLTCLDSEAVLLPGRFAVSEAPVAYSSERPPLGLAS
jgi:hypothetical protein